MRTDVVPGSGPASQLQRWEALYGNNYALKRTEPNGGRKRKGVSKKKHCSTTAVQFAPTVILLASTWRAPTVRNFIWVRCNIVVGNAFFFARTTVAIMAIPVSVTMAYRYVFRSQEVAAGTRKPGRTLLSFRDFDSETGAVNDASVFFRPKRALRRRRPFGFVLSDRKKKPRVSVESNAEIRTVSGN